MKHSCYPESLLNLCAYIKIIISNGLEESAILKKKLNEEHSLNDNESAKINYENLCLKSLKKMNKLKVFDTNQPPGYLLKVVILLCTLCIVHTDVSPSSSIRLHVVSPVQAPPQAVGQQDSQTDQQLGPATQPTSSGEDNTVWQSRQWG